MLNLLNWNIENSSGPERGRRNGRVRVRGCLSCYGGKTVKIKTSTNLEGPSQRYPRNKNLG